MTSNPGPTIVLISLYFILCNVQPASSANRNECPLGPFWTAEGKDVMDEKYGVIVLLALLELQCQDCIKQLNGLMTLQRLVDKNKYERTQIVVVTPWLEPRTSVEYWRARLGRAGIDLVQEDQDQPVTQILAGKGHDFFVFDRCGRIAFHVPYPQSFLYYHYTISVIHNTYNGWCGPCPPYKLPRLRTTAPYYNHPEFSTRPSIIIDPTALSTVNAILHPYNVRPGESNENPDYVLLPDANAAGQQKSEGDSQGKEGTESAEEVDEEEEVDENGVIIRKKGRGKGMGKGKGKGKGKGIGRGRGKNKWKGKGKGKGKGRFKGKGKGGRTRPKGWRKLGICPKNRPNCKRGRGHRKGNRKNKTTTTTTTMDPYEVEEGSYDYEEKESFGKSGKGGSAKQKGKHGSKYRGKEPGDSSDYGDEEESFAMYNQTGVEGGNPDYFITTSPAPTPYFMPYEIPGVDCSIFSDNYCYNLQQKRKPIHPCCYKGVYLTNLCVPGKCSNETYHVCCFQRFHQARYRCCNDASLNCDAPDEFSKCCYEIFAKDPKEIGEDPCCPASVAKRHWNIESRVVEYCVPNLELNYGRMELRAQMKDHSSVRIKLAEFKPLHYQCPYALKNRNCDPYYYQPEYDGNYDSEYN